jgi:hypothetical protein
MDAGAGGVGGPLPAPDRSLEIECSPIKGFDLLEADHKNVKLF